MICPKCLHQNPNGAKTCANCGAPLEPSSSQIPQVRTNASFQQPWFKKKIFIFSALALLSFLIIGIFIFALLSRVSSPKIPPKEENKSQVTVPSTKSKELTKHETDEARTKSQITVPSPTSEKSPKTRYDIDTDGDDIPDFVETALGFNPNQSAELACIQQGCSVGADWDKETPPQINLIFILDSSGSMAEKIQDQTKMEIAKQALRNYIEKLPENINFGLVVYGHKGSSNVADKTVSCQGIETVYPISRPNRKEFLNEIETFQPTGWTPIGSSLRFAGKELKKTGVTNNYVVLISDGVETCNSDPIDAAKDVVNTGSNIQVDVIGFAVDQKAKMQLAQIAQVGDGQYFEATTAPEFANVLDQTLQRLQKLQNVIQCTGDRIAAYRKCNKDYYQPAIDYLEKLAQQAFQNKDEASKTEYTTILNTKSKLYSRLSLNLRRNSEDLWKVYSDTFSKISKTTKDKVNK